MKKHNAGYTLIEVLVAISLLGILVVPICSNLVISLRVNARTDEMLRAQLAVSSAVETLMAEGITEEANREAAEPKLYDLLTGSDRFENVYVETWKEAGKPYYKVKVQSEEIDSVSVETYIRAVAPAAPEGGAGG